MAKEFSKSFYYSKRWKECRKSYISKRIMIDGGLCERCKEKTGYILHHKTKLTPTNINNPDITLNHCNLEYVCKDCHDAEHYYDMHRQDQTPVCFDSHGQIIPRDDREK